LVPLLVLLSVSFARRAVAQEIEPPFCDISDSTIAYAAGLDDIMHPFGQDTETYPNEFDLPTTFPAFSQVFDLYLSDGVSDRWSQGEWEDILAAIMSNDTTDTDDDVFGKVWSYFCRDEADSNFAHAGVRFKLWGVTYTRIVIVLYDKADFPIPCPSSYGNACKGWSSYSRDRLVINASAATQTVNDVVGQGVAHELQHLCFAVNQSYGYEDINETLSTLAEYLVDSWRSLYYDIPYDASIMRYEPCDLNSKYQVEKIWIAYLYEVFKGNVSDPSDDLIYRWIRNDAEYYERLRLPALAAVLWENDFDWVGGEDALDRLNTTFANFLVAKFCNAPDFAPNSEFGSGPVNTVLDFGLFLDNCASSTGDPLTPVDCPENPSPPPGHAGCWNVRIVAPEHVLADDHENVLTTESGIYEDGDAPLPTGDGDGSTDYIDVWVYGTDYIIFRPGSYFDDDGEHELEIRVGGEAKYQAGESQRIQPMGWIMGYSSDSDTLQVHPESLVFVEPITFSPSTTVSDTVVSRTVTVTDFGRSIKAVVVAIGAAALDPSYFPHNDFIYEYQYGVFTPGASSRTWEGDVYALGDVTVPDGGTLDIEPDTYVHIYPSDLWGGGDDEERIELAVDGELNVNGTVSDPIIIRSWNPTTSADWAGFYFTDESAGGTFEHCVLKDAEVAIDSYAPITLRGVTIENTADAGVRMWSSTLDVNVSVIRDSDGDCIGLDDTEATIDSTTIEDYADYGVYAVGDYDLDITNSEFLGDDVGVYVENNYGEGTIANCTFEDNDTGIWYYASYAPQIEECVITGNAVGVQLDSYSSISILHCINSSSYDGNITSNTTGVLCVDYSSPALYQCNISSNVTGVWGWGESAPNLMNGQNKLMSNSKHIRNSTQGLTIDAQGNYWSTNTGSPNYYPQTANISGSVDYSGALTSGPNPVSRWPGPTVTPPKLVTGLGRAHPNPFNPTVAIPYTLAEAKDMEIQIYDVSGRLVRTLVHGAQERGEHSVTWDGSGERGVPAASSVYFVRMRAGAYFATQKIVLLK